MPGWNRCWGTRRDVLGSREMACAQGFQSSRACVVEGRDEASVVAVSPKREEIQVRPELLLLPPPAPSSGSDA